ncbi:hypothetical protein EG328_000322 [Venturia inaequalis]|uniref:Uncharacterized protein n=1 Tax=Venturia inaequalis TaxID=5025 RepID=A0A8H3UZS9_VENIN|nr:hypothetical protein EG328_000322 [Venturia inaequalis]
MKADSSFHSSITSLATPAVGFKKHWTRGISHSTILIKIPRPNDSPLLMDQQALELVNGDKLERLLARA